MTSTLTDFGSLQEDTRKGTQESRQECIRRDLICPAREVELLTKTMTTDNKLGNSCDRGAPNLTVIMFCGILSCTGTNDHGTQKLHTETSSVAGTDSTQHRHCPSKAREATALAGPPAKVRPDQPPLHRESQKTQWDQMCRNTCVYMLDHILELQIDAGDSSD